MIKKVFLLGLLLNFWTLIFAQGAGKAHFIEAKKLASQGNYKSAFALIENEAERENDCTALGYYWLWSLQYGNKLTDSSFRFVSNSTNKGFGIANIHTFKTNQTLERLTDRCPTNGSINQAMGYRYWKEATETVNLEQEALLMDKSVEYLQKALRGGAYDTLSTYYLAIGLEFQAKFGEAIRYYQKTYGLDDSHYQSLLNAAACFGKLSQWDSCIKYAQTVLTFTDDIQEKATAYRLKAEAIAGKEDRKSAHKLFKKSLKLTPNDYDNNLAFIEFLYQKRRGKACKRAIDLLDNNIFNKHIHVAYDFIFSADDALKIYEKSLKKLKEGSVEYKHLKAQM